MKIIWDKKTKTIVWISVGLILLIILIIILSSQKSKAHNPAPKKTDSKPEDNNSKPADTAETVETNDNIFPLKYGKSGKEVEQAQLYTFRKYGAKYPKYGFDGVWGDETEENMKNTLKKNSISKDFFYKAGMHKIKTTQFK